MTCQVPLDLKLIKMFVVKAAKFRGQAAEHPNELKLCGDKVNNQTEPCFLSECETVFGLMLNLG
jgi:hypothetical protein